MAVMYPVFATGCTAVHVFLGIAAALATIAFVPPNGIEAFADVLPSNVIAWLVGTTATIATISGAISKVMLIPRVSEFLQKWGLGTAPAGAIVVEGAGGTQTPSTRRELGKQWESR